MKSSEVRTGTPDITAACFTAETNTSLGLDPASKCGSARYTIDTRAIANRFLRIGRHYARDLESSKFGVLKLTMLGAGTRVWGKSRQGEAGHNNTEASPIHSEEARRAISHHSHAPLLAALSALT